MNLHTLGIDLGKTVFHLVGLSPAGQVEAYLHRGFWQAIGYAAR